MFSCYQYEISYLTSNSKMILIMIDESFKVKSLFMKL